MGNQEEQGWHVKEGLVVKTALDAVGRFFPAKQQNTGAA